MQSNILYCRYTPSKRVNGITYIIGSAKTLTNIYTGIVNKSALAILFHDKIVCTQRLQLNSMG